MNVSLNDKVIADAAREDLDREARGRVLERGMADYKAGRVVDGAAMETWLDTWGDDDGPPSWRGQSGPRVTRG